MNSGSTHAPFAVTQGARVVFSGWGAVLLAASLMALPLVVLAPSLGLAPPVAGLGLAALWADFWGFRRQAHAITIVGHTYRRLRVGEPLRWIITLHNAAQQGQWVRVGLGQYHPFAGQLQVVYLPPQSQVDVLLTLNPPLGRGAWPWPPVVVVNNSPWSLYQRVMTAQPAAHLPPLYVWPAAYPGAWRHPPQPCDPSPQPVTLRPPLPEAPPIGRGPETPGPEGWLREWRQGERLAHVAHKASAKRERWLLGFVPPPPPPTGQGLWLDSAWALSETQHDLELAVSLLSTLAQWAQEHQVPYGLVLPTVTLPWGQGEAHDHAVQDALAEWTP